MIAHESNFESVGNVMFDKKGSYENDDNDRYITMDEYNRLLDVAICQEWRVIFALVRIGGLRAPSEVLGVRWSKVDWDKNYEFVINRYRDPKTNLGTRFKDAAVAASLGKIPRRFDNMRASRSTEIDKEFGPKKESVWIGHTPETAHKHYLMVTENDFAVNFAWENAGIQTKPIAMD